MDRPAKKKPQKNPPKKKLKVEEPVSEHIQMLSLTLVQVTKEDLSQVSSKVGYRNKIAYTLGPTFATSELAQVELNQICSSVQNFQSQLGAGPYKSFPASCLNEVSAKICRSNEVLLKLSLVQGTPENQATWKESVEQEFINTIVGAHPCVVSITCQWSAAKGKTKKGIQYETLYGSGFCREMTTNGESFFMGPDTFSEVNHEVDDAIFDQALAWFKDQASQRKAKQPQDQDQDMAVSAPADLIVVGRDANSFTWGFMKTGLFERVHSITTCPCAFRDWKINREKLGYNETNSFCSFAENRQSTAPAFQSTQQTLANPASLLITASRKGLSEQAMEAIKSLTNLELMVYVSCNQNTIAHDFERLLTGTNRFFIKDFRSWDGLAGTEYTISACLLVRPTPDLYKPCLVLPIGPPGCGKTTFCSQLGLVMNKLGFLVKHIERDSIFAEYRATNSLKETRKKTHAHILGLLETSLKDGNHAVVCLDSTNGNSDAREIYAKLSTLTVLVDFVIRDMDLLVERCFTRETNNLAFSTKDDIVTKIENVIKGLESPGDRVGGDDGARYVLRVDEQTQIKNVVLYLLALLVCSRELVKKILLAEAQNSA